MASEVARHIAEDILHVADVHGGTNVQGDADQQGDTNGRGSSETFTRQRTETEENGVTSSSSYTLASTTSQLSGDVDRWIFGSSTTTRSPTETTGIQGSRVAVSQRSTLTSCRLASSAWYLMALALPLFSVHNCVMQLRCTPSTLMATAELVLEQVSRACGAVRRHLQRLAREQAARELFAAAMDVVLVVYALGFLVLSMYQASVIG